jgi:hypothetical protein
MGTPNKSPNGHLQIHPRLSMGEKLVAEFKH